MGIEIGHAGPTEIGQAGPAGRYGSDHPPADLLEAYGGGELAGRSARDIAAHANICQRCRSKVNSWRELHQVLSQLPRVEPSAGLTERILARTPDKRKGTVRVLRHVWRTVVDSAPLFNALSRSTPTLTVRRARAHLDPRLIDDLAEGVLPPASADFAESHTLGCSRCAEALGRSRATFQALSRLGHIDTSPGFADRIMAAVETEAVCTARKVKLSDRLRRRFTRPGLAPLGWILPQTTEGWARLGGLSVTPLACLGFLAHTLVSHPTMTGGELVAYAWWKVGELGNYLVDVLAGSATTGAYALGETGLFRTISGSALWLALGLALYASVCLYSAKTIYRWTRPTVGAGPHVPG